MGNVPTNVLNFRSYWYPGNSLS